MQSSCLSTKLPSESCAGELAYLTFPSRNLHSAVFRCHLLPLRVPHHQPYQIASRFYIEARPQGHPSTQLVLQRFILQSHFQYFFVPLYIISVAVKKGGNHGEIIPVPSIHFSEAQAFHVHAGNDREFGL